MDHQYRAALIEWASLPDGQRGPAPVKRSPQRVQLAPEPIPAWLERFSLKSLALTALRIGLVVGLVHLLTGCGGATSDADPPIDATADLTPAVVAAPDAGTPAHTVQGEVHSTLPRCVQSPEPGPGWCQQTRFGERVGYDTENWCAFWVPFSPCS